MTCEEANYLSDVLIWRFCFLSLEENGIITECNIKTLETESMVNFEFDFDKVVNKVIMKVTIKLS